MDSQQITRPLQDLPNQNVYGEVFINRERLIQAMEKLGLKIEDARGKRSSAIRFRGEIDGIQVVVNGNAMKENPSNPYVGSYGHEYVITYNPSEDITVTHFKMKAWIPNNTHLRGKGRDGKAWQIYHAIYNTIVGGS